MKSANKLQDICEVGKDNIAWERAKAEVIARFPYDTNFGRDWSPKMLSMLATRAQEIKDELQRGNQ